MTRTYLLTSLFALSSAFCHGQSFLNGSFESTTSTGCDYFLPNDVFNSVMDNVSAFGSSSTVDVLEIDCSTVSSIPDGIKLVALGMDEVGEFDAISLELSASLITGNDYTISFMAYGVASPSVQGVIIGCSTINNDFGSVDLYTVTPNDGEWIEVSFTFTAPNDAMYITVKPVDDFSFSDSWGALDDFKISPSFASVNEGNAINSIKVYPTPSNNFIRISGIKNKVNYVIYNSLGTEVGSGVTAENEKIDIQNISDGIYFIRLDNGNSMKFIKE